MRTNEEIIASLKKALLKGIESASHLERYKLEYIDVNISVCPGEPPLFEGKGCNAAELWQLIGDFERLSNSLLGRYGLYLIFYFTRPALYDRQNICLKST